MPRELADLSRLRALGSTGAPLPPEGFRWVYEAVGDSLQLQSISGGTDVCTGFVGASPLLPVWEGEISCRYLGAKVEAYDPAGQPVDRRGRRAGHHGADAIDAGRFLERPRRRRATGRRTSTSSPGCGGTGTGSASATYGSCVITGRSDATLNRGGVRLGTSEFYSVVESLDEVLDSVVVHLEDAEGGAGELLLFVVLADGLTLDDALRARIARELRTNLSPRHVPDEIYQVRAVPRTLSAKKLEVPVKRILTGTPVVLGRRRGRVGQPGVPRRLRRARPAALVPLTDAGGCLRAGGMHR